MKKSRAKKELGPDVLLKDLPGNTEDVVKKDKGKERAEETMEAAYCNEIHFSRFHEISRAVNFILVREIREIFI